MRTAGWLVRRAAVATAVTLAMTTGVSEARGTDEGNTPRVRKSVSALSARERADFVAAVLALKATPSPYDRSLNYYDQFVQWHKDLYDCSRWDESTMLRAHGGPMFLPWHREYLRRFELALREVSGKDVTIPYWDWTNRAELAVLFGAGFMGGDGDPAQGYAVTTGPFAKDAWRVAIMPRGVQYESSALPYLVRRFDQSGLLALPTAGEVEALLGITPYDTAPWDATSRGDDSFRNSLEGFAGHAGTGAVRCDPTGWVTIAGTAPRNHNAIHGYVGGIVAERADGTLYGTMVLPTSPNDPVFFLHHANIDRLWAEWQRRHGLSYLPRAGLPNNDARSRLLPFTNATPDRVESIAELGYAYAGPPEPVPVAAVPAAASTALFCRIPVA